MSPPDRRPGPAVSLPPARPASAEEVELGSVLGPHGLKGEVRLFLHHRDSDLLRKAQDVILVSGEGARFRARVRARPAGRKVIARIDGVDTPEAAAALRDWRLRVERDALPAPEEDEFYWADVVGAPVHVDGERVGVVRVVHATGPVEVLEVLTEEGALAYVPCVRERIAQIGRGGVHLHPGALVFEDEE